MYFFQSMFILYIIISFTTIIMIPDNSITHPDVFISAASSALSGLSVRNATEARNHHADIQPQMILDKTCKIFLNREAILYIIPCFIVSCLCNVMPDIFYTFCHKLFKQWCNPVRCFLYFFVCKRVSCNPACHIGNT